MALLRVRVIPKASKQQIIREGDRVKIKLVSPPQDGRANKELKQLLSKRLKIPKSNIKIVSGEHFREKNISIHGLSLEEILERLG
ncbi:MAG: DUF167 domain-containing protein [Deltaproteobacteria bacterium]|nr:MAG: DUF167 domain-containing protein [Deltaproteobacteria bacterium]